MYKEMSQTLLNNLTPCPNGRVHDGGCGLGYYFKGILEKTKASQLVGTDLSREMLEKAKKTITKLPNEYQNKIELQQLDLTKDWPKGEFDAHIFFAVINYLPNKGWQRVIQRAFQTLTPGGYIYTGTLLKGLDVKKLWQVHLIEQALRSPISAFPSMYRAKKIMKHFDESGKMGIILAGKDEYLEYHKKVGFKNIDILGTMVWGNGVIVKAQKTK